MYFILTDTAWNLLYIEMQYGMYFIFTNTAWNVLYIDRYSILYINRYTCILYIDSMEWDTPPTSRGMSWQIPRLVGGLSLYFTYSKPCTVQYSTVQCSTVEYSTVQGILSLGRQNSYDTTLGRIIHITPP